MVETVTVGADIQIIDLRTGKLTRQGLLYFQNITTLLTDFNTHEGLSSTTSALGHVKQGAAVTDGIDSGVSVTSSDVSAGPASYNQTWGIEVETLANELKTDLNTMKTDLNLINTQLSALLTSLETAGIITT